jgi:MarR-like DNA-binding transcriptional regulator SgrR of sgrS sRNA
MNIKGFEPYYQEQHKVFRAAARQLQGIRGIKVTRDSTIVFTLIQPDDHFLRKLASPYAVIYPPKAAKAKSFTAVGAGPFTLAQKRSDSLYIFGRFSNYQGDKPLLNRVNVVTRSNPAALLKAMNRGAVDLIPELGPKQQKKISNANGGLKKAFAAKFRLLNYPKSVRYELLYNAGAKQPEKEVAGTLNLVLGSMKYQVENQTQMASTLQHPVDSLSMTYSSNPFVRSIYAELSRRLAQHGVSFHMSQSRVVNRNIALSMRRQMQFTKNASGGQSNNILAAFVVTPKALAAKNVHHFTLNEFPWWFYLDDVTVSSNQNQ